MDSKDNKNTIFREKSLDKVSSPEALNDYIRVTTPSVWIVLIGLAVLLVGMLAWSIFGRIPVHEKTNETAAVETNEAGDPIADNVAWKAPISYIIN